MQYKQYTEEWFEKNKYTEEWDKVTDEYFAKKKSFKNYLECISDYIQSINEYLLERKYDEVREYAGYAESTIERERKTMEEIPELKTPETEKFLEESLNKAKAAIRRCPEQNTNTYSNTPWSDRYYKEESYQEKKARWDYEDSQIEYRNMQWKQQQPWFNH
jgi:hypothetical protein